MTTSASSAGRVTSAKAPTPVGGRGRCGSGHSRGEVCVFPSSFGDSDDRWARRSRGDRRARWAPPCLMTFRADICGRASPPGLPFAAIEGVARHGEHAAESPFGNEKEHAGPKHEAGGRRGTAVKESFGVEALDGRMAGEMMSRRDPQPGSARVSLTAPKLRRCVGPTRATAAGRWLNLNRSPT